jgi:hypothetical protein
MKIEYVTWLDSSGPRGTWFDKDDAAVDLDDMTVVTVGFVVAEDADRITLAHSQMGDMVGQPITIPKRAIVSRYPVVPVPEVAVSKVPPITEKYPPVLQVYSNGGAGFNPNGAAGGMTIALHSTRELPVVGVVHDDLSYDVKAAR